MDKTLNFRFIDNICAFLAVFKLMSCFNPFKWFFIALTETKPYLKFRILTNSLKKIWIFLFEKTFFLNDRYFKNYPLTIIDLKTVQ